MRTPPSSPWIIRCSVQIYRWLLCLGPCPYRRQYADHTLQLFRECCQEAFQKHGVSGVLSLWLPLFSDVVVQMLAEHFSELRRSYEWHVAAEMGYRHASERAPAMDNVWQRINRRWIIPPLSALTRFRRKLTRPLLMKVSRELNRPRLKHPTNLHFEQHFRHWRFLRSRASYESGIDTTSLQVMSSAFLRSTTAEAEAAAALRQTVKADDYRGKQLRFSGDVKVEQVGPQAGLWVEAIVHQPLPHLRGEKLKPENVMQGTHGWMRYEETISIPEDALFIRFGVVLHGKGQIWLANAQLEVIEQDGILPA